MSDFSELNEYLMPLLVDVRRDRIITACQNLAAGGNNQLQPDIDRLLNMSNDGEAPDVIDDIHKLIFEHMYSKTLELGFVWAEDVDWLSDFNLLTDVMQGLMLLDGVEDYGEISRVITDELMSTEEKVTDILTATLAKDMSILLERVDQIAEETIIGIAGAITGELVVDEEDLPPPAELDYVKARLVKYHEKFYKGLAYEYIVCGGALGVDYESLLQLFNDPLGALIDTDLTVLTQELIGFALVSNIIDDLLQDEVCKQLDIYVDDKMRLQDLGAIVTGFLA